MQLKVRREGKGTISVVREIDEDEAKERKLWLTQNIAALRRRIKQDLAHLKSLEEELNQLKAVLPDEAEDAGLEGF
ncbi:MAG: hypothetical protein ACPLRW_07195 [Moorellales bacterium]